MVYTWTSNSINDAVDNMCEVILEEKTEKVVTINHGRFERNVGQR